MNDEILKSVILSFEELKRKLKSKDVCSSSELVCGATDNIGEPKPSS